MFLPSEIYEFFEICSEFETFYSGPYFPTPVFSRIPIFQYSDRMRENMDRKNSEYGHFLSNVYCFVFS